MYRVGLMSLAVATVCTMCASGAAAQTQRPWRPEDTVAVRQLRTGIDTVRIGFWDEIPVTARETIRLSPDGEHFFFITKWGELARDCQVVQMDIFAVADVTRATNDIRVTRVEPKRRVRWCSGAGDGANSAISAPRWSSDDAIIFFGVNNPARNAMRELYRLHVSSGEVEQLTRAWDTPLEGYEPANLSDYLVAVARDVTVYAAMFIEHSPTRAHRLSLYPVSSFDPREYYRTRTGTSDATYVLSINRNGRFEDVARMADIRDLDISPDGRWAVVTYARTAAIPAGWERYAGAQNSLSDVPNGALREAILNVVTGELRNIVDAPACSAAVSASDRSGFSQGYARMSDPFDLQTVDYSLLIDGPQTRWFDEGNSVLMCSMMPWEPTHPERARTPYIISYNTDTGAVLPIVAVVDRTNNKRLARLRWIADGALEASFRSLPTNREDITGSRLNRRARFTLANDRWRVRVSTEVDSSPNADRDGNEQQRDDVLLPGGVALRATESPNQPPTLTATFGDHRISLIEEDPALAGVTRAIASDVSWIEPDGRAIHGQLYLPPTQGSPPPLVIEIGDLSNKFIPGGPGVTTGFGGQALVSEGFAVLQIGIAVGDPPQNEPRNIRTRIDAAVASLRASGTISDSGLAVIGFSRTGWIAHWIVTHPGNVHLDAAVVADSITGSYIQYIESAALRDVSAMPWEYSDAQASEHYNGGNFWQHSASWNEEAIGFSVADGSTPVLFMTVGVDPPIENMGAYKLAHRPFYQIMFPAGSYHQLQTPREQLEATRATVDWINFWMRGRENEARPEQTSHWRYIRNAWERTQREETGRTAER